MAEDKTQGVQNKWLLIIAVVLGLVTVFIYSEHIDAIRDHENANKVSIIEVKRNLRQGDNISLKDIKKTEVPRLEKKSLGNVMLWPQDKSLAIGKPVNQAINKGQFLLTQHLYGSSAEKYTRKIADGMVGRSITFNADSSVGDLLSPGDTVNLMGNFRVGGRGAYKIYRILDYVRVVGVGGKTVLGVGKGMSNYRKITIEVTPEVSEQLVSVLTHLKGDLEMDVNRDGATPPDDGTAGKMNEDLKPLWESAADPSKRGR
jgi:Flp pilus assembly protein CpaB